MLSTMWGQVVRAPPLAKPLQVCSPARDWVAGSMAQLQPGMALGRET
jgi:hypothetical protein